MFPEIENFNFVVVGLGRVGTSLLRALNEHFKRVEGIHSEQVKPFFEKKSFKNLVIFLTVKDSYIEEIAEKISKINFTFKNGIVFHTCGVFDSSILKSLKEENFSIGSFHPLFSFHGKNIHTKIWKGMYVGIEVDNVALNIGEEITKKLGSVSFKLKGEEKSLYHALASLFSQGGFVFGDILDKGIKTLHLENSEFIHEGFKKLLLESFENRLKYGEMSGTGPAIRDDKKTIGRHLNSLKKSFPEAEKLYNEITEYILKKFNHQ